MNFRADGSTFGENMSFNSPGGGGGGFLEKTFGESPLSQEKREEKTGAVPVTVAAIFNAEYDVGVDGLVIDGVHIHQVIIIGMVVKVVAKPLYLNFAIEDHTGGQIKVTKWVDHQESPEDEPEDTLREDTYVGVYGMVRNPENAPRHIIAFHMWTVVNFSEIVFHLYEVMNMHVYLKRRKSGNNPKPGSGGISVEMIEKNGLPSELSERPEIEAKAYQAVAQFDMKEHGAPLYEVSKILNVTESRCRDILVTLQDVGLVYTTMDDNHFKAIS